MERLIAVNENRALYHHVDDIEPTTLDPFTYLNDLLSIRSAKGFVSFLKDHPHGLRDAKLSEDLETELASKIQPEKWDERFFFSEQAIRNAAKSFGVKYLDADTDLEGHYDGIGAQRAYTEYARRFETSMGGTKNNLTYEDFLSYMEDAPKPDLYTLDYVDFGFLFNRIYMLLYWAAEYYGKAYSSISESFTFTPDDSIPSYDKKVNTLKIEIYHILALLPSPKYIRELPKMLEEWNGRDNCTSLYMPPWFWDKPNTEIACFAVGSYDKDKAIHECIGDILAFALSTWLHHFGQKQMVTNNIFKQELVMVESQMNDVVVELCNIIIEGRLGLCKFCDRPFVVKRKPVNGQITKKYCTESCKVKDYGGKEVNDNGKEETT